MGRILLTQRIEENRAINQKKPIKALKINKLMKNAKTINYFTISIIIIILCKTLNVFLVGGYKFGFHVLF